MKSTTFILILLIIVTNSFSQTDTIFDVSQMPIIDFSRNKPENIRYCNGQKCNGIITDTFDNGQIQHKGFYIDGKLNGSYVYYYSNGNISSSGTCDTGKNVGTWHYYYENGNLGAEYIYYKNTQKTIKSTTYHKNGKVETKEELTEDLRSLHYYEFNEKGDTIYKFEPLDLKNRLFGFISYYDNGQIEYSGQIQEMSPGQKNVGVWKWFDMTGALTKEINY